MLGPHRSGQSACKRDVTDGKRVRAAPAPPTLPRPSRVQKSPGVPDRRIGNAWLLSFAIVVISGGVIRREVRAEQVIGDCDAICQETLALSGMSRRRRISLRHVHTT